MRKPWIAPSTTPIPATITIGEPPGDLACDQQVDEDDAEQGEHRADRELDAAGDDDEACADREQAEQADQVRRVATRLIGDMKRGLMRATTSADHQDQDQQAEILLQHRTASASCRSRRPTASRITFSSLNSARSRKPRDAALVHHRDAVADADHLLHVARDHQDGDAGIGQPAHQPVDLRSSRRHRCRASARRRSRPCGVIDSHLASTTFCWLPPDSVPTGVSTDGASGCRARPGCSSALRRSAPCGRAGRAAHRPRGRAARCSRSTEKSSTRPERLRSSGTR